MTSSMTAFARREGSYAGGVLVWELRSVNHRYLEVAPRLPEPLRALEPEVRAAVKARLGRGKLDCSLQWHPAGGSAATEVNWAHAHQWLNACQQLIERSEQVAPVAPLELLRMPGVLQGTETDRAGLGDAALALLEESLSELVSARASEGARLAASLQERAAAIAEQTAELETQRGAMNDAIRERLRERLAELDVTGEAERLEQEVALVAQRRDIDEELARLRAHLAAFHEAMAASGPVGRRLDFLMQEFNREANTMGSKVGDTRASEIAVDMKVYIEQMREQVQNIE